MRYAAGLVVVCACSAVFANQPGTRALTFEERVRAQGAIERVYYAHQVGASSPFEKVVPPDLLEKRVRTYLKQSVALERFWKTPITATMLQRERERMERSTRMPERLRELYAALNQDSFLIEECLVRATLADRLSRNFLAYDERFQGAARARAVALHDQLISGALDPRVDHPARTLLIASNDRTGERETAPREGDDAARRTRGGVEVSIPSDRFERWADDAVGDPASAGAVIDEPDSFLIKILLDRDPDRIRVASFRIDKRSWDDWWDVTKQSLDEMRVAPVASEVSGSALAAGTADCPADDTWDTTEALSVIPATERERTAVWTGTEMVVWGWNGPIGSGKVAAGKYDPETDTWTSVRFGISARIRHTAVWTGSQMIVWGGVNLGGTIAQPGGRYDPATDSWTSMSTLNSPQPTENHTAVWTGSVMVVWGGEPTGGGEELDTGGRYDPVADTWTSTSTTNAPAARTVHTAVWTGTEMVVWGGISAGGNPTYSYLNTGGRYDPVSNTWTPTSTVNAPDPRAGNSAVWTGTAMVVWGGYFYDTTFHSLKTGGRYNPTTDSWSATATTDAPLPRLDHSAVWTGTEMIVWGGVDDAYFPVHTNLDTGGRYNPVTDTWSATSTVNAISDSQYQAAVWTGSRMIVWRGRRGARYDPASDTWTPIASAPTGRRDHAAVWTGSEMIVWGGDDAGISQLNTGGRYNPVTDAWTLTSTGANVPEGRFRPKVVWTGTEMIVWGGDTPSAATTNTGGRYNPITDTWTPTAMLNAPSARGGHTLVWTGGEMIVWGGSPSADTGGRYDPATDTWTSMSTVGAPSAGSGSFAAWSGSRMVVWDGNGGRYDPVTDTWSPISTTGAPSYLSAGVWTGSELIVLGDDDCARYDPETDLWTVAEPPPRPVYFGTFVWAGSRAVLWGGDFEGYRYNPMADTWTPISLVDEPFSYRRSHSAVWTGRWMIVWGGYRSGGTYYADGGRYAVTPDDDSDGFSACGGDCNDSNTAVHPGAIETCNAIDDNCDNQTDEDASGVDSDGDSIHNACDNCVFDWNVSQSDFDHDNQGDMCDVNDGLIYVFSTDKNYREWQAETGYTSWNSYRGSLAVLRATGLYTQGTGSNPLAAHDCAVTDAYVFDDVSPGPGAVAFNLVTGVVGGVESGLGTNSAGVPRANANPCP